MNSSSRRQRWQLVHCGRSTCTRMWWSSWTKCISGKILFTTSFLVSHLHVLITVLHCIQYMYVYACTLVPVGAFVGFTELGDMNTHLADFEEYLQKGAVPSAKPMAKSMLVLMVRGLNSGLQFPYAQFPCATLRGDQMFHIFWKAVGRLQRYGFRVMGLTCDGLAANRQLFRLHAPKKNKELVYKTSNPYSVESHCLFFLSDPPHLLKTIRNCFANKNRHFWVRHMYMCIHVHVYACEAYTSDVHKVFM